MLQFNYHHLYYFYAVAEHGSITKAAQSLRISQPALSAQLRQFEDFLDKNLFERKGRRLELTEDGLFVLGYAKSIFDLGNEMVDGLHDRRLEGKIRVQIGVSTSVPKAVVQALIQFLFQMSPRPHLVLKEAQMPTLLEELNMHGLDLMLSDAPVQQSQDSDIRNHLAAKIPVVFCAHRTIAGQFKNIPKDLQGAPLIMPTAQNQIYHALQTYFQSHSITPDIVAEIGDVELVRRMVLDRQGVAPINRFTVLNAPSHDDMVILNPRGTPGILDTVYLIEKKRRAPNPIAARVIQKLRIQYRS